MLKRDKMKGEKELIVINPHNAEDYLIDELIEYLEYNAWDYRRGKNE